MSKIKSNESSESIVTSAPSIDEQAMLIAKDTTKNVSVRIRELSTLGIKNGPIVKVLTAAGYLTKNGSAIRFQHVRNVLNTPLKKS
jgi:hypothetical protein